MSSQDNLIFDILKSPRTVFTPQSLLLMGDNINAKSLAAKMHRYVHQGHLKNPRKGIYAKEGYRPEEMACSIFKPSYISLEYVLQRAGVVFQYDTTITSVSYLSRMVEIDGQSYSFRKIGYELWAGMDGIITQDNVSMATPERAFLDMLYLSAGNCYFDNLRPLNKKVLSSLLPHYQSHMLAERVHQLLNL